MRVMRGLGVSFYFHEIEALESNQASALHDFLKKDVTDVGHS
jgi:hypothetical protein